MYEPGDHLSYRHLTDASFILFTMKDENHPFNLSNTYHPVTGGYAQHISTGNIGHYQFSCFGTRTMQIRTFSRAFVEVDHKMFQENIKILQCGFCSHHWAWKKSNLSARNMHSYLCDQDKIFLLALANFRRIWEQIAQIDAWLLWQATWNFAPWMQGQKEPRVCWATSPAMVRYLNRPVYTPLYWSGYRLLLSRWMFEPRHNIISNVRTNVRKYVVTWLERSRESNRPVFGPFLAELSIRGPVRPKTRNRSAICRNYGELKLVTTR